MFGDTIALSPEVEKALSNTGNLVVEVLLDGTTLKLGRVEKGSSFTEKDAKAALQKMTLKKDQPSFLSLRRSESYGTIMLYLPDSIPAKKKFSYANAELKISKAAGGFDNFRATELEDMTWAKMAEATKQLTEKERLDAMTITEKAAHETLQAQLAEQRSMPTKLAGMAAVSAKMDAALEKALSSFATCGCIKVELSGETLCGTVIAGAKSISDAKVGADTPAYILMPHKDDAAIFILWSPDNAPGAKKMKISTLKASLVEQLSNKYGIKKFVQLEAHDNDELNDIVTKQASGTLPTPKSEALSVGGKKLPPGAMAMPGMGGFKLPGK